MIPDLEFIRQLLGFLGIWVAVVAFVDFVTVKVLERMADKASKHG